MWSGHTLVVFGGLASQYVHLADVWLLDTRGDCTSNTTIGDTRTMSQNEIRWVKLETAEPEPRRNHCAAVVGDQMFIFGRMLA